MREKGCGAAATRCVHINDDGDGTPDTERYKPWTGTSSACLPGFDLRDRLGFLVSATWPMISCFGGIEVMRFRA